MAQLLMEFHFVSHGFVGFNFNGVALLRSWPPIHPDKCFNIYL